MNNFNDILTALANCDSIPTDAFDQLRACINDNFPSYFDDDDDETLNQNYFD